jgi:adenosine/AMP kinase
MDIELVPIAKPDDVNVIVGQAHFIKTVDDIEGAIATAAPPSARFAVAFCEASGKRLVRRGGNDPELIELAVRHALAIGAGHSFFVVLRNVFPIAVLNAIKAVPEVCRIICATANDLAVLVAIAEQGRGIVGVIDGATPLGVETEADVRERRELLRRLGYVG